MTRTATKRVEELEPGDIVWRKGGGKRVVKVERIEDSVAYYGVQKRWRVELADGTAFRNTNTHEECYVVVPDCAPVEGPGRPTIVIRA